VHEQFKTSTIEDQQAAIDSNTIREIKPITTGKGWSRENKFSISGLLVAIQILIAGSLIQ